MTDEVSSVPQDPPVAPAARSEDGTGYRAGDLAGPPPGEPDGTGGAPSEAGGAPAGPAALGVVRTATGHAAVDARLERLADADRLPADGHVEVYEDVHRGLRDALTALDAPVGPRPHENRS
ncbi:hypothetical protein ABZY44_32295 [Streptomyces sp. NPDC006544]|uniref:hypothetical protein n=1 Tax=Streptomyces sp. NPDC006544 TaxID=3154583 RepID=UPI0033AF43B0